MNHPDPVLYTPAVVARIRELSTQRMSTAEIARSLGWDASRVYRIARRHGVDIAPVLTPSLASSSAWVFPAADERLVPAAAARVRARVFGKDSPFARFVSELHPSPATFLRGLMRRWPDDEFVHAEEICLNGRIKSGTVRRVNIVMRNKNIGFQVESRKGEAGGFRLVKAAPAEAPDEAAP